MQLHGVSSKFGICFVPSPINNYTEMYKQYNILTQTLQRTLTHKQMVAYIFERIRTIPVKLGACRPALSEMDSETALLRCSEIKALLKFDSILTEMHVVGLIVSCSG